MFKTYKQYENGGQVLIPKNINKKGSDYKQLVNIANLFAKEGKIVRTSIKKAVGSKTPSASTVPQNS